MSNFDETVSGNDKPTSSEEKSFPRLPYGLIRRLAAHFSLTPGAIHYRLRNGHQKTIQQAYVFMKEDIDKLEDDLRRLRYQRIEEARSTIRTIIDLSHESRVTRLKQFVMEFEAESDQPNPQQELLLATETPCELEHA
ncbi:MAG TPA: hypothetical protein PLW14_03060 [Chlorobiota bacterium]|nr:hypothetical protein [Chlorobiota bacterium]